MNTYLLRAGHFVITLLFTFYPLLAFAQTEISQSPAPTSDTGITYECKKVVGGTTIYGDCTFADLITAVEGLIKWATIITLQICVVVIAVAGFKYMTSQGNPGKIAEANKMFLRAAQGIALILAAWLIVNLITGVLVQNPNVPNILRN